MTTMPTNPDLRKLLGECTPLPWVHVCLPSNNEIRAEEKAPVVQWMGFDDSDRPWGKHAANVALIVAAVNALPDLLDQIESLQRKLGEMRKALVESGEVLCMVPVDSPISPEVNRQIRENAIVLTDSK